LVLSRSFFLDCAHSHQRLKVRGISNGGYFVCPRNPPRNPLSPKPSLFHCLKRGVHSSLSTKLLSTKLPQNSERSEMAFCYPSVEASDSATCLVRGIILPRTAIEVPRT
jgi:hypothetical protein